jgi:hypothetical protein
VKVKVTSSVKRVRVNIGNDNRRDSRAVR